MPTSACYYFGIPDCEPITREWHLEILGSMTASKRGFLDYAPPALVTPAVLSDFWAWTKNASTLIRSSLLLNHDGLTKGSDEDAGALPPEHGETYPADSDAQPVIAEGFPNRQMVGVLGKVGFPLEAGFPNRIILDAGDGNHALSSESVHIVLSHDLENPVHGARGVVPSTSESNTTTDSETYFNDTIQVLTTRARIAPTITYLRADLEEIKSNQAADCARPDPESEFWELEGEQSDKKRKKRKKRDTSKGKRWGWAEFMVYGVSGCEMRDQSEGGKGTRKRDKRKWIGQNITYRDRLLMKGCKGRVAFK
ncbi:hypothetical protein B0H19DRAFT_1075677 [Mycena capillaripes]|nr:hypothetical protein B0H19DRAFT_1075677 [Mycena capillaripes]